MPVFRFILGMILAYSVGSSRLNQFLFLKARSDADWDP
jgi:hypothetical protein